MSSASSWPNERLGRAFRGAQVGKACRKGAAAEVYEHIEQAMQSQARIRRLANPKVGYNQSMKECVLFMVRVWYFIRSGSKILRAPQPLINDLLPLIIPRHGLVLCSKQLCKLHY